MNVIIIIIISIQLCIYKYVIPWKDLKTGSHVRYKCKCKRKRKLKRKWNASELIRPKQTQGKRDTQAQ